MASNPFRFPESSGRRTRVNPDWPLSPSGCRFPRRRRITARAFPRKILFGREKLFPEFHTYGRTRSVLLSAFATSDQRSRDRRANEEWVVMRNKKSKTGSRGYRTNRERRAESGDREQNKRRAKSRRGTIEKQIEALHVPLIPDSWSGRIRFNLICCNWSCVKAVELQVHRNLFVIVHFVRHDQTMHLTN